MVDRPELRRGATGSPLTGSIVQRSAGSRILAELELDLAEHLYLADHTLVHAPGLKPVSACLPVLPFSFGLEMMIQTAAHLAAGRGFIGLEQVEARRWIALEDSERLRLRISVEVARDDRVSGIRRVAVAVFTGSDEPALRGTVLFGGGYTADLELRFTALADASHYPIEPDRIYAERHLFHGPSLRCLAGETRLGAHGLTGALAVHRAEHLFASTATPELATDPVALDGLGQLLGLWALERDLFVFPLGLDKLELYRPTPNPGTVVPVSVEIRELGWKVLTADAELQDGAGSVWLRVSGWKDWIFRWSERQRDFRRQPTRYLLSRPLPSAPDDAGIGRVLERGDIDGDDAALLARFCLHPAEMDRYRELATDPAARHRWLLGRIAAKDAARLWLRRDRGAEMLHPAAILLAEHAGELVVAAPASERLPALTLRQDGEHTISRAQG